MEVYVINDILKLFHWQDFLGMGVADALRRVDIWGLNQVMLITLGKDLDPNIAVWLVRGVFVLLILDFRAYLSLVWSFLLKQLDFHWKLPNV